MAVCIAVIAKEVTNDYINFLLLHTHALSFFFAFLNW